GQISDALFARLQDESSYHPEKGDQEISGILQRLQEDEPGLQAHRLISFIASFYKAIQLSSDDDDNKLSQEELINLRTLLTFAAVTAAGESSSGQADLGYSQDVRRQNRRVVNQLREALNSGTRAFFRRTGTEAFKIYQPRGSDEICLHLAPEKNAEVYGEEFGVWFNGERYSIYISGYEEERLGLTALREQLLAGLPPETAGELRCDYEDEDEDKNYLILFGAAFPPESSEDERFELLKTLSQGCCAALAKLKF
ncbi:MAG: hypothetical protein LBS31_11960, partial [Candidatus Adiutrix sp.]|nr:hypothetical protein [Candidatus Adiutrix sp.]